MNIKCILYIIKHEKCTNDSPWFFRRFTFNDVNVSLSLLRISDSWSSSMLRVLEQAFLVGRGGGDYVGTWLDGTTGQIEGGSFGQDFPLFFISSKPDGQCNAQTTISLLTLKLALGIALIRFLFLFHLLGKDTPIFCHFSISQKNSLFHIQKHNISFLYLISNKNLINWFNNLDKNLNVKSVYLFLSMLFSKILSALLLSPFSISRNV